jgi:hypothetical protein
MAVPSPRATFWHVLPGAGGGEVTCGIGRVGRELPREHGAVVPVHIGDFKRNVIAWQPVRLRSVTVK